MKYFYVFILSIFLVGCGGGNGSINEGGDIKADPTKQIKTEDKKNTPPVVPEV
jgi:hypothetical protein